MHRSAIADRCVTNYAAADPGVATYLGISGSADQLSDLAADGYDQLTRSAYAAMQQVEPTDDREQAAKRSASS